MMIATFAALGAALCWAAGGLLAMVPVRALGAVTFNRLRMVVVGVMLAVAATVSGGWSTLGVEQVGILALSGLVGVVAGDTALFWALGRIGPRRNSVLFATNAPMTAGLGWLFLGETLGIATLAGVGLVTAGVMLAVFFRLRAADTAGAGAHDWETVRGTLAAGVAAGLVAALCQAAGSVIAKPAMVAGADPLAAAAVRVGTAAVVFLATTALPGQRAGLAAACRPRILGLVLLNGAIGLGLGMTLLMVGLAHGSAGVVATLSATSPVLVLPMLWAVTGKPAAPGAWAGAIVAVAGVALIVNR